MATRGLPAVYLLSEGGQGGDGHDGSSGGGGGGHGGDADSIFVDDPSKFTGGFAPGAWDITLSRADAPAFLLQSIGGDGGDGVHKNGKGGNGGDSGDIWIFDSGQKRTVSTDGDRSPGLDALSLAGAGGKGDQKGDGGVDGLAGQVSIAGIWDMAIQGNEAPGIVAISHGGAGGGGGSKGSGGGSGTGGSVSLGIRGDNGIETDGYESPGILAQSIGGRAGAAGDEKGFSFVHFATSGGSAGDGGGVKVASSESITTRGDGSDAIKAEHRGWRRFQAVLFRKRRRWRWRLACQAADYQSCSTA